MALRLPARPLQFGRTCTVASRARRAPSASLGVSRSTKCAEGHLCPDVPLSAPADALTSHSFPAPGAPACRARTAHRLTSSPLALHLAPDGPLLAFQLSGSQRPGDTLRRQTESV